MTDHDRNSGERRFRVTVEVEVEVVVGDLTAITRCTENTDNWRGTYYDIQDEDEVLEHFAFNAVANHYRDASRLDGWADLDPGVVTFEVDRSRLQFFDHRELASTSGEAES